MTAAGGADAWNGFVPRAESAESNGIAGEHGGVEADTDTERT
jgi:hypothetical protein